MTKNEFQIILDSALSPIKEKLTSLEQQYSAVSGKQSEVIELASPPAGSDPHQRHHAGGDPERGRYRGY